MASWHECLPFQQYHGIALLSFYVGDITKLCYIGQSWLSLVTCPKTRKSK
jgi:hypothetical protein